MRVIDADALLKALRVKEDEWGTPDETWRPEREYGGAIKTAPTVEAEPVRHGRWEHERLPSTSGGSYAVVRCSVCEYQYPMNETNYCPNCGARMDGEE